MTPLHWLRAHRHLCRKTGLTQFAVAVHRLQHMQSVGNLGLPRFPTVGGSEDPEIDKMVLDGI